MLGGLGAAYLVAHAAAVPVAAASRTSSTTPAIVLIAGAMICAVGVLDDLFELDALTKLGGQVLAAGLPGRSTACSTSASRCPAAASSRLDPAQGALLTVLRRGRRRSTR